jgi:hypothetical protein
MSCSCPIPAVYATERRKQYLAYIFSPFARERIDPLTANLGGWRALAPDNDKGATRMRLTTVIAAGLLAAGPVIAFGPPAHSEQNDLMGQAQRFLNGNNNGQTDRDAYQRGREDEMRHQQAGHDRGYRRDYDQRLGDHDRDLNRDSRYRSQDRETYNYNRYP